MSSRGLSSLKEMTMTMHDQILNLLVEDVEETAKRMSEDVNKVYQDFFVELETLVLDLTDDEINDDIVGNIFNYSTPRTPPWPQLTDKWAAAKRSAGLAVYFYNGLTHLRRRRNFVGYLASLAGQKHAVDRFFGPTSLRFDVSKAGRGFSLNVKGDKIKYTPKPLPMGAEPLTAKQNKKPYDISATITVFPKLRGVRNKEWDVVDSMIRAVGAKSLAAKQLMKINGRGGYGGKKSRPVRAIITPMIAMQLQKMSNAMSRNL